MKIIKSISIFALFLFPILAFAEESGCGDDKDCFPKGSNYFGVTTGTVQDVVDRTKQGTNAGAQSACEEMYGSGGCSKNANGGWSQNLKSATQVGTLKHDWKEEGREDKYSKKDYKVDSQMAVGVKKKKVKKNFPDDVSNDQREASYPSSEKLAYANFHACFEPRLISKRCEYCNPKWVMPFPDCIARDNRGYVWEYWWPEFTIDVNNFGIASINPSKAFGRNDLMFDELLSDRKSELKDKLKEHIKYLSEKDRLDRDANQPANDAYKEIKDRQLIDDPIGGQSHFAGISPEDQSQNMEAHLYKAKVTTDNFTYPFTRRDHGAMGEWWYPCTKGCCKLCDYWWNGYIWKDNFKCHYDSIPDKMPERLWPGGWTEQTKYAPYWRFPELSGNINSTLYRASVPSDISFSKTNKNLYEEQLDYGKSQTCSSYRTLKWSQIYKDLNTVFDVSSTVNSSFRDICYVGGGQLYPLTGNLLGYHHPLTSPAVIARRAIELIAAKPEYYIPNVPRFTDESSSGGRNSIDKLQMVYPRYSKCFRMNPTEGDAENLPVVDDTDDQFPADAIDPKQLGVTRFIFWNRRTTCSCQYRSTYEDTKRAGPNFACRRVYGWGCQIFESHPRGNGRENPKDKFYGSTKQDDEHFADAAWQLYFRMYWGKDYPIQHFIYVPLLYEKFDQ